MKICYLNHDLNETTGAGRFCLALTAALKKLIPDFDYRVLTHEDQTLPENKLALLFALPKIRNIFRDYDIIHALDGWPYGVMAALGSLGLKKKLVITAIGTGAIQPLYNFWKRPLLKWAYRKADAVTAVSNNTKKEILKVMPDLQIGVINHGVDSEKFKNQNSKFKIIEDYKPYILSVGALKKRKGLDYSVQALAEIAQHFPDLKYVIVGDGPEKENLQLLITNYQLQKRVIFLKNLSEQELVALYKNAELFILLPQDDHKDIEGFGLVFLEAAAAGLPVVATKDSSAEDAILDGKNGFLVPAKDSQKIAEALSKILSDPQLKKELSENSLEFAKSMNWEKVAKQYLNIYEDVIHN